MKSKLGKAVGLGRACRKTEGWPCKKTLGGANLPPEVICSPEGETGSPVVLCPYDSTPPSGPSPTPATVRNLSQQQMTWRETLCVRGLGHIDG